MQVLEAEDPHLVFLINAFQVTYHAFTWEDLAWLMVLFFLLISSALFSGSEVAYFSLTPGDLDELKRRQGKKSRRILELYNQPEILLGTILVGNNFVNIGIVILSSYITNQLIDFSRVPTLGFIFQVVIITFLLLLFGEIMPKIYANQIRLKWAEFMAFPIKVTRILFSPFVTPLVKSTNIINRKLAKKSHNISINDLSEALDITSDSILEDEKILKGITKFGNLDAREIMTPRLDVFAVDIKIPFRTMLKEIIEEGFSRVPVYIKSLDHIKGILYIKDILPHLGKNNGFAWQSLIRPPYFVPETKKIDSLLEEFQANKIHMAVVIDEYGGTSGIVTLEDILEEIVGEIEDEQEGEESLFERIGKDKYVFEGKILLNDFYKVLSIKDNYFDVIKGDAETLAGLILAIRGKIPGRGEVLKYRNFTFRIIAADNRRIEKIEVIYKPEIQYDE
ncbi:MAG TPA: gliding motility-associated protein GldE [Bacteroidetes bacterium]|nr:gliding motility-associated protein GldE [Bacteroidota bacterium]